MGGRELYALQHNGIEHEVAGKAYILLPDIGYTARGSSVWQGMRHHEIASVRGLYYDEDAAIGVWEVIATRRLDAFTHGRLWLAFESWLTRRFPTATRIVTDDAEPGEDRGQNREFLADLGYRPVAGAHGVFAKALRR